MNQHHIIFHIPMHLNREHASASQIRPMKLLTAFQSLGYQVDLVEGTGRERKKLIALVKQKIKSGIHYDFLYSESSVMPTLLTESHHLPIYPCLDFSFFKFCNNNNIPIGLFYRDIYWCFINKGKDWKQRVAKYFYQYDLHQYEKYVDVLYLPTLRMFEHIPFHFARKVMELPAGCELQEIGINNAHNDIEILYIGGIGGDYDLTHLMEAVSRCPFTHLTLCCRPDDWNKVRDHYAPFEGAANIDIVHKQGDELPDLYRRADFFSLLFPPTSYRQFAAPFKLFEAIGFQTPLLGISDSWSGQFIETQQIGLTCDNSVEEIVRCFQTLNEHPELIKIYQTRLNEIAPQHTWQSRCQQIADSLTKAH